MATHCPSLIDIFMTYRIENSSYWDTSGSRLTGDLPLPTPVPLSRISLDAGVYPTPAIIFNNYPLQLFLLQYIFTFQNYHLLSNSVIKIVFFLLFFKNLRMNLYLLSKSGSRLFSFPKFPIIMSQSLPLEKLKL